ncbi:MAG: flagellar biosynthesis protein FlgM [Planctomycetota bacterium]|nr:MAG: flagellar biosynthesis protein FlgM [Planctomycetota bacterium]
MIPMKINPISIWGHGQLLCFSGVDGPTSYHDGLCLRTIATADSQADGPQIRVMLPATLTLHFGSQPISACDLASDHFAMESAEGSWRGAFLDAWHLLIEGPLRIEGSDPRLKVRQEGERTLIAVSEHSRAGKITADLDAAIAARRLWADSHIKRLGIDHLPTAVKAVRQMKGQVYAPEGIFQRRWTTPDRWPHRGCWLWDSAFHALGLRHCDPALARDAIAAVFDGQQPDGMVPIRVNPGGTTSAQYTQPPTLALAVWGIHSMAPDPAWLRGLLPRLEAYLVWDERNRLSDHGLPCWAIEANPNCRSGESGLDNASRFDTATRMEAVDFASFLALEWELLGKMHEQLDNADAASRAHERCQSINTGIQQRLWDDSRGFFYDWDVEGQAFCPVAAVTGFLPLICGAASPQQAQQLFSQLENPDTFGTTLPLPSVARNDPSYTPDMWRGPVWVNMVYLVALGCERYGRADLALRLRSGMKAEIERWQHRCGTFFEYYDPDGSTPPDQLKRKGKLAPETSPYNQCFHDYGWTATLYFDMLLSREALLPPVTRS